MLSTLLLTVSLPNFCLSSPLLDDMMNVVNDIVPAFGSFVPDLLQTSTAVAGGGTTAVTGGGTTAVTTLPAPVVTTTTTPMMTMAPGIAVGILGALLLAQITETMKKPS